MLCDICQWVVRGDGLKLNDAMLQKRLKKQLQEKFFDIRKEK